MEQVKIISEMAQAQFDSATDTYKKYSEELLKADVANKLAQKASLDFGKEQSEILTEYSSGFSTIVAEMVK